MADEPKPDQGAKQQVNTGILHGGGVAETQCRGCGHVNQFIVPPYEIVNSRTTSMLVFAHQDPQVCEKCGTEHQFLLTAVDIKSLRYGFPRLAKQVQAAPLIAPPPPGFDPSKLH